MCSKSRCIQCLGTYLTEKWFKKQRNKKAKRNHPLIHRTLIISVINKMVGNHIRASDVDRRITSLKNNWNRRIRIRKVTETRKRLKLVHIDQRKQIRFQKTVHLGHTWLYHKEFCMFFFIYNKQNAMKSPHGA